VADSVQAQVDDFCRGGIKSIPVGGLRESLETLGGNYAQAMAREVSS
jgi:hypothetical protein